jgi:alginate O-acetyltransferase complex protein AlgJ
MASPDQPLPAAHRTREEIARIEVGNTAVAPALARWLVALFLSAIVAVSIVELAAARARGAEGLTRTWAQLAGLPRDIQSQLSSAGAPGATLWRRLVSANREVLARLSDFERALDDESVLGRTLRRPAQRVMTGWLGSGNERVYPGRNGWLFYRPDVEYLTGQRFLDPAHLERRVAAASEWETRPHPDPREAIVRFHRDLQARGITLIVMPTPLKAGVHPEMLARRRIGHTRVLQNQSFADFVDDLTQAGVLVFDPGRGLAAARSASPQYLMTDTHWLPETMETLAELLAGFIEAHVQLPAVMDPAYLLERVEARNTGDTARMLDLPENDPLLPPEAVWLRRVLLPDGSPWRSSRTADVLLLGDSFTNIYALESMGWGTSAGLAEQLSYSLRRPVDRLVQNDQGAFATRAMLQKDADRLVGTRVVVYQFAARELAFGDWKILPLPGGGARSR